MSTLTRKQFLLGGLASTATLTVLGACADDPQPSDDDVGDTGDTSESGTTESTGSTSEEESTSEEATDTVDTTTEDETTDETTDDTDTSTDDGTDTDATDTDTTDSTETGEEVCPDGASGTVLLNHGHELIIPTEDVQAAVQKVYDVQGVAGHNHQVTITPADFAQLALGNVVMKTTTFIAQHDHEVLISCLL